MLLNIKDLSVTFIQNKKRFKAVNRLNLTINRGEIVALVGESGSGKSLSALSILRLLPASARVQGKIFFRQHSSLTEQGDARSVGESEARGSIPPLDLTDLNTLSEAQMRKLRGSRISMIFQEPMTALNPLHSIGKQLREVIRLHEDEFKTEHFDMESKVQKLIEEVGLSKLKNRLTAYPHQLSGGERQRVMIAMALACDPDLLLADEPTTAVDVTIQAQLLALLKKLQKERGLSILLITHDLTIVRKVADRVAIMQKGRLVESGVTTDIFANPTQEYTQKLLGSEPTGRPLPPPVEATEIISGDHICVSFPTKRSFFGTPKEWFHAVDGISVSVRQGTTLGIVGESGSGKTTLALALLRLIKSKGKIVFLGQPIDALSNAEMRQYRNRLQIVFQDPYGSLNPRMTVNHLIGEGLRVHRPDLTRFARRKLVRKILAEMGLSPEMLDRYPHEFSGGQRQRIAIARAMVLEPEVVVLDEPTSALDLTVQAQIIELLKALQQTHQTSFLFISHDLRVVRALSHQVMVMQHGKVVELADADTIYENSTQDYTRNLIHAAFLEKLAV
jgi:microcin C transport system ATP-binding protein